MSTRYKAFISYSHRDADFAVWLHKALESWRVPRDLTGRTTPRGPVPRNLRPVFRDRDDFAGGASLKTATLEALRASEFMVVLCSPAAAASTYVNEEVRLFKAMGRSDRVIPVIIAGEPGSDANECFPDAVKYTLNDDGDVSEELAEPLAPDAREHGDGRQRAVAKIVAGLLGLAFDEIVRRAEQARRQRVALFTGLGAGAFLFATAFGAFALYQRHQAELALQRSVFAIGGLIQETDHLDEEVDVAASRAALLMNQCSLMDGLARGGGAVNPLSQTICMIERAVQAFEREHTQAALTEMQSWQTLLERRFAANDGTSTHDVAVAMVRAARASAQMRRVMQTPDAREALHKAERIAHAAALKHQASATLRDLHEQTLEQVLEALRSRDDHARALDLMIGAAALRALQAKAASSGQGDAARLQAARHLRVAAWTALNKLDDAPRATELASQAIDVLTAIESADEDPDLLHESALAWYLLGEARASAAADIVAAATGSVPAADSAAYAFGQALSSAQAAAQALREAGREVPDELRALEQYLQQRIPSR